MTRRAAERAAIGLVLLAAGGLAGCKDEPPPPEASASDGTAGSDAAPETKPAVDPKIASAMAAATEASARAEGQSPAGQVTPPADGILSEDAAARELAPGSPATLVLGSDGSAPRVRLGGGALAAGATSSAKLTLSYRSGGSVMPTVELELRSKVVPAAPAATPSETAPASLPASGGSGAGDASLAMRFSVASARPAESQPGRLPENAKAEIAKLSGSSIERVVTPSGAPSAVTRKLAGDNADLEPLLTGSAEALASALLPLPEAPVGAGAFWMVKSRETANGAAVLAYRMVKLVELGAEQAKLSVSTRRYLLEPSLSLAGLPPHRVRRFESEGEATLSLRVGASAPVAADVRDSFMALVSPSDRPSQALPVQSELSAQLTFSR